eukprot:GEMP01022805.1.p1 GENE.GEMP01022805.1~~GEMP01022805.1.p1  ORF type:complete len:470 (+),score=80.08 GEMP01022805.1:39-1448(+)
MEQKYSQSRFFWEKDKPTPKASSRGAAASHSHCFCGWQGSSPTLGCTLCGRYFHITCIAKWQRAGCATIEMRKTYVCGVCRVEKLDPFHKVVHTLAGPIVCDSRKATDRILKMSVTLPADIRGQEVQLRAIGLDGNMFTGPSWPNSVEAHINYKKSFRIDPPKYLHTRREQNHDLTNVLQGGKKTDIELRITFDSKQATSPEMTKAYLVGCFLTKPVAVDELLRLVRKGVRAPADRYKRVLAKLADETEEVACVSHAHGRTMSFVDPVSHCRIETPCIGVNCVHLQTFDLDSYLHVNSQTRNLSTRWHCPICNIVLLPQDLAVDTFMSNILGSQSGLGKVVIKDDGGWEVILEDTADVHSLTDDSEEEAFMPKAAKEEVPVAKQAPAGAKLPIHALPRKPVRVALPPKVAAPKMSPTPVRKDTAMTAQNCTSNNLSFEGDKNMNGHPAKRQRVVAAPKNATRIIEICSD